MSLASYERQLNYAIEQISDHPFGFYKVSSTFCSSSAFSQLDFEIEAYRCDSGLRRLKPLTVKDLFKVEAVDPAFTSVLKFIVNGRNHLWPPSTSASTKHSEKEVMLSLCSNIFTPLSSEVILEKTYAKFLEKKRGPVPLQTGYIGMGSTDTWHGTPDARVRGTDLVWLIASEDPADEFLVSEDSDDKSDGTATPTEVEGKVVTREANLMQTVGTCVVSSFTATSRHPDKLAMVPTILIDGNQFLVCLYHCEKDVLLISDRKLLATKGHMSRSGLALLWLVINHRLFLQELPTGVTKYPALIKSQLETSGRLCHFTSLTSTTMNWHSARALKKVKYGDLPFEM